MVCASLSDRRAVYSSPKVSRTSHHTPAAPGEKNLVERRREPRIRIDEYVRVTALTDPPGNPIIGKTVDLSGRGLSLVLPQSVPRGVPVRVDQSDRLLLGDIVYCLEDDGVFRVGIQVDQTLRHTADLQALRDAIQPPSESEVGRNADVTMKETLAWTQNST